MKDHDTIIKWVGLGLSHLIEYLYLDTTRTRHANPNWHPPDAAVPPPTATDDSDICRTLDHLLTVQAAQGQILVDVLDEICALRVELAQFRPPDRKSVV